MSAGIHAEHVGVRFLFDRQQRTVTPTLARLRRRGAETWGLRNVSFSVGGGEGVALIGASGAGKTTLLRALAGIVPPDAGSIRVRGRVASLLSPEAGLLPTLTGRENALLLAVLGGFSRAQGRGALAAIEERSRLEESFARPVSSYSEGMRARLGFAVAEQLQPEILLLDEVHEALDHEFRERLAERADAVLRAGGVVVAAGHEHPLLEQLCNRALLLRDGTVVADGDFRDVQRSYLG